MKQELIDFIISKTHLKADEIKPELKLAQDIGFYGLDSISFFDEFFDKFEIQNTDEFDVDLYIDGSVDFALEPIKWIKNIFIKERKIYLRPDVTMGHLEKVIEAKKWINNSLENRIL